MRVISCVNDECFDIQYRLDPLKEGRFIAVLDGREIELEIIERKPESMTLSINGHVGFYEFASEKGRIVAVNHGNRTYSAKLKNEQQQQLEDLLAQWKGDSGSDAGGTLAAPMPGKVLAVKVKPGDKVEAGQVVLVLEAMKMENELGSPGEGTVKAVKVQVGQTVNNGDVMIELEA
jgi:biotin carboxyl carrier protein